MTEQRGIYLTDATINALAAERAADVRSINDLIADLAIAELRLREAETKLDLVLRMLEGRVQYEDRCARVEVYEALIDEITLTVKGEAS